MYFPVLLWSIVIFASFWGYGEALRRALKRPEFDDLGWGLTAAWGMAITLAIGGFLMMFSLAKAPMLTGVVLAGAALALYFVAQRLANTTNPQPASKKSKSKKGKATEEGTSTPTQATHAGYPTVIANILVWGLAALAFASSIAWPHHIDPNDDLVCYLMLPQKILATGTLIEPFSFQRAGTFGGQALLQAMVMIVGNETSGHVPDRGLAMLAIFGILLGVVRGLKMPYALAAFVLLFSFWFVPVPRISTNAAMTGGCLLIALLDSFNRLRQSAPHLTWSSLLPSALLVAGASSIRPTYSVVIACIFMSLIAACLIQNKTWIARWNDIRPLFFIGLLCTALLIPFMTVLYESNGTPLIPPFSGFVSKAYQTYDHPEFSRNVESLLAFISAPNSLAILFLFLPVFLLPGPKNRTWILLGVILAYFIVILNFGALAYLDIYRYTYPLTLPILLWYLAMALKHSATFSSKTNPLLVNCMLLVTLFVFIALNFTQGRIELIAQAKDLPAQIGSERSFLDPRLRESYTEIQKAIPQGEVILTMVDASYWLDYKRNTMFSINAVGSSSPPPGIPFGKGPEAFESYLQKLGIKYIIAVDFDNAVLLYTRRLWTAATRPEWIYAAIWRPRFLDVMNTIDYYDKQGKVIARSGNLRAIKLGN